MRTYLKKLGVVIVLLICSCVAYGSCALANDISYDEQLLTVMSTNHTRNDFYSHPLYTIFHISDDEVWYNFINDKGYGELACLNSEGELIHMLTIDTLQRDEPTIQCMSRVGNHLMIGYQDNSSLKSEVIILDEALQEISRTSIDDVCFIMMVPSKNGILFAGYVEGQDETTNFCLSEIDEAGCIRFKQLEAYHTIAVEQRYISNSMICSDEDIHYAIVKIRMDDTLRSKELLSCHNAMGEKLWEVELPSSFYTNSISAANGYVYLIGSTGDQDENGCLINQQASVKCYDQSGSEQWQQVFPEMQELRFGVANTQGCYAASDIINNSVYAVYTQSTGATGLPTLVSLPEGTVFMSFSLSAFDSFVVYGKTLDSLFMDTILEQEVKH